jgi:hypothetical protein
MTIFYVILLWYVMLGLSAIGLGVLVGLYVRDWLRERRRKQRMELHPFLWSPGHHRENVRR